MSQYLVFNHHSLPFDSKEQALLAIPDFIRICSKGENLGLVVILVDETIDAKLYRVQLANGYCLQDWYNQAKHHNEDREIITAFLSVVTRTRQPFFVQDDRDAGVELFDVHLPNDKNVFSALRAAAWHESPIVSFPTRKPWHESPINIIISTLDDSGNITDSEGDIVNIYSMKVLDTHKATFQKKQLSIIQTGKDIINKKNTPYKSICICENAEKQLLSWCHSQIIFNQVKESLCILNVFAEKWKGGEFSDYSHGKLRGLGLNHQVSGESESVRQNPDFRKKREFYLPDGNKVFFENHIKLSNGFRIYFYNDNNDKSIYVGYVGKHLPLE